MKIFTANIKTALALLFITGSLVCHSQANNVQDSATIIEKVYIHTDRDYYLPGDTLWFKAYLIDASHMLLSDHSKNLHVEIISHGSVIIDSRIVRIDNGLGKGDFILPDSLESGSYFIRAYTNHMRNFGEDIFFNKEIKIFSNTDSEVLASDSEEPGRKNLNLQFFPEGGSLVDEITSAVGFKATDGSGFGCDVSGIVYSSSGDSVTSFRSSHKGMGKFPLRPRQGMKYFAVVSDPDGKTAKSNISESFATGIVLNVTEFQNEEPLITIRTNSLTLPLLIGRDLLLIISVRNKMVKTLSFKINSLFTSFRLPVEELPYGILRLTLSGPDHSPMCERLIFHGITEAYLKITTDKPVYGKRSQVSGTITFNGNSLFNDQAFISLSAAENAYLFSDYRSASTISSWFLLESDIRGMVEDPSYYFNPSNTDRSDALDLLLCTQGWRDFKWKYQDTVYKPENGFFISGRVEKLLSHKSLKNSSITAFFLSDYNAQYLKAPPDSTGRFCFEGLDLSGKVRIIISSEGGDGKLQGNLILDNPEYIPEKVNKNELIRKTRSRYSAIGDHNIRTLENDYRIKSSIQNKHKLSDTIMLGEIEIISRKNREQVNYQRQMVAVGIPDNIIEMTPRLQDKSDFRDLLKGKVSGLTFESTSDPEISGIRIRGSTLEPLFMLDGIKVSYGEISSLPFVWIDRIEVLKSGGIATTLMSPQSNDDAFKYGGVISVITKPPELRKEAVKPVFHSVNRMISGYDVPRIFYSPRYYHGLNRDNNPDLRSTLFWEPDISVRYGEEYIFNYFNADKTGKITITAEGFTYFGIPVTGTAEYEIN